MIVIIIEMHIPYLYYTAAVFIKQKCDENLRILVDGAINRLGSLFSLDVIASRVCVLPRLSETVLCVDVYYYYYCCYCK